MSRFKKHLKTVTLKKDIHEHQAQKAQVGVLRLFKFQFVQMCNKVNTTILKIEHFSEEKFFNRLTMDAKNNLLGSLSEKNALVFS